jgi:hypothetical protein
MIRLCQPHDSLLVLQSTTYEKSEELPGALAWLLRTFITSWWGLKWQGLVCPAIEQKAQQLHQEQVASKFPIKMFQKVIRSHKRQSTRD